MNAVSSAVRGDVETKASVAEERGGKSALRRERRRALARQLRLAGLGLGLVTVAAAGAWALRPRPVAVDLVTVSRGPLALVIEESGVTRVQDRFVVSAPVSGSLSRLSFEPGDQVKEGDALAQIAPLSSPLLDPRTRAEAEARLDAAASALGQARAQVARATAAREQSALELDRTRQLSRSGALPPQALEQAEFGLRIRDEELASATFAEKIAKEELRMARVTLDRGSAPSGRDRHVDVLAPASGQVLRVHRESAGAVQAGTALLEVGNPEALEIVVDLLTTDAVRVTPGTRVSIGGWGGSQLEGKVSRVEPSGFTRPSALGVDEQRVNVIVAIMNPRQDWAALGDGYRVEARLVLWQSDTALQVPSGAVFRQGDGWATFRVREGSARLTPVKLGHRGETAAEVVAGLASGDAVVMHPGDRVKDGIDVSAR